MCIRDSRCIEANIPNTNLNSRLQGSLQQSWDCVATKGRLECEVQSFSDCTFQQSLAFMPCGTGGVFLDNGWIRSKDAPGSLIWIEIFNSMLQQGLSLIHIYKNEITRYTMTFHDGFFA